MHCLERVAIAALTVLTLAFGRAEARVRPHSVATAHACLSFKERRAANESGKVIHLAAAIRAAKRRVPGSVVRARLCRGRDGLVYVLTILRRNGKVVRLTIDAVKGTLLGKR
jgi:uncharacterized membrane protein YkoI